MRVLFVTGEYPPLQGGVGDYTATLADYLTRLGVEVMVLTSSSVTKQIERGQSVQEKPGAESTAAFAADVRIISALDRWDTRCWRMVAATIRQLDVQVVHIQYQTGAFGMHPAINLLPHWFRLWKKQLQHGSLMQHVACLTTFHDLRVPYLFPKAGPVRMMVNRLLARGSDAVVLTNAEDYTRVRAWKSNSYLIPIGSNIPHTPPPGFNRAVWRERLGVHPDEFLLAYFGFINNTKGVDTLLLALEELLLQRRRIKLVIVGGTTDSSNPVNRQEEQVIRTMIDKAGLHDNVLWTGFTSPTECSGHLLCSDVAVLPFKDGVSLRRGTLMAVLNHGLPVVTTYPPRGEPDTTQIDADSSISIIPPQLINEENVLLVPPGKSSDLAHALVRLMDDPDLCARLAQGACDIAHSFAWEDIATRTLALYRRLVPDATSIHPSAA